MRLSKAFKNRLNNVLFVFLIVMALSWRQFSVFLYTVFSAFQAPLDQFIIPGLFFYWHYREKFLMENLDVPKIINKYRETQIKLEELANSQHSRNTANSKATFSNQGDSFMNRIDVLKIHE